MKLIKLGPNMTELEYADGTRVLVSYETPVAALIPRSNGETAGGWKKSDRFFSRTTSAHISKWLEGVKAETLPHAEIAALVEGR